MFLANRKFDDSYLVALLPEALSDNIISWGYDYIPCGDLYEDRYDPSFGREKDIHVTLLGPLDEQNISFISSAVHDENPITCVLGKIDLFKSNSKYDVIKIEVVNQTILNLNQRLSKNICNTPRFPLYIPHVTIAYVKKGLGDQYVNNTYFEGQQFNIIELQLSHKSGQKHIIKLGQP